jgi:uncharacterized protein (DUF1501 family)
MTALATSVRHFGLVDAYAQKGSSDGANYKALVCVFLDGGNDGNNTIVPNYNAGYDEYFAARGAQGLAIPRASLLPITPLSLGLDYGLHPTLAPFKTLWDAQKLAIVCNVGTLVQPLTRAQYQAGMPRPVQLFSHSDQTNQHRSAISSGSSTTGWGGRTADRTIGLNPGAAIAAVTSVNGSTLFTAGNSTTPLVVAPSPTPLNQVFALNGFTGDVNGGTRRASMDEIRAMNQDQTLIRAASDLTQQAINVSDDLNTDPPLTVTFPATPLGNQLRQVAKLMKFRTQLNMSRQIFYVRITGFDTHSSQLSRQVTLFTELANAVKAFYDETVAQGIDDQVTTFTLSDFNRTLNPAGSGAGSGSDHAWGNHAFVIGGAVRGGDFFGRPTSNGTVFPTLVNSGPDDADTRGRFIPTSSVDMFAATLASWYGVQPSDMPIVFPNINSFPVSNLGFML